MRARRCFQILTSVLGLTLGLSESAWAGTFTTYAAWSDQGAKNIGRMYIYTGNYPSTDVSLFNASTPNTAITAPYCGFPVTGVGPYQPVFEVGSCPPPAVAGFGNNYFMCQSTNPIVWEVEEPIATANEDSHDFLAAADTHLYIGSVFMTYMRDDAADGPDFGDQVAVINTSAAPITAKVRLWSGVPPAGAWGPVIITSPSIPPMGIWMWSPNEAANNLSGGTDGANQGHYRFDLSGPGMLYKGDTFTPCCSGNRDNLLLFGPDVNSGIKVGTDMIGAVVTAGMSPHIVVNNTAATAATFNILRWMPNTPATVWPMSGADPTGTWALVSSGTVPANQSYYYNAGTADGFYRVQSTNGIDLTTEFGSFLIEELWCDGDYMYASDTRRAFGRQFIFGGRFQAGGSFPLGSPVELHVICPVAGTSVSLSVDGSISGPGMITSTQVASANNVGLRFPILAPLGNQEFWTAHLSSTAVIYAYVMSNDAGSSAPGETFFSVPPPIDPLLIVNKAVNKSTATVGDVVTYTLVGSNPGSNAVSNAQIWDTLPAGTHLVAALPPPSVSTPPYYLWNLGTVASGQAVTLSLAVQIDAGVQLEVKHNIATGASDITQPFPSNDAPVLILIPGANLKKTVDKAQAMPGDILTYVLSYTNSTPPPPGTPKLDLLVHDGSYTKNDLMHYFEVVNKDSVPINISDLQICFWVSDDTPPGLVQINPSYGGGTYPWAWGGPALNGSATAWMPPQTLPANRKANMKLCIGTTSTNQLAPGQTWLDIQERFTAAYPQQWANHYDDYSQPTGSASYISDYHFALYYQGTLVTEYSSPTTPDPNTGREPAYLWMEDYVPANVTYGGSSPAGVTALPQITWAVDSVAPGTTQSFTWWGSIGAGTPPGTIINNAADYSTAAGPGISNMVQTLVGSANVGLTKSINKNVFTFGDTVTYCMAWSNTGTAPVAVTIWDTLAAVLTYIGSDNGGSPAAGNLVVWNLGTQPANSSGTVCVWARITAYPLLPPWRGTPEAVLERPWRQLLGWWRQEPWTP